MTPERLAELERLASEACDGEDPSEFGHWEVRRNFLFRLPCDDGSHVELDGVTVEPEWSEGDVRIWCELPIHANFIAAANPATILDIIAHIRDLEAQVREARESVGLVRMMLEMSRARRSLRAPEDDGIRSLCERIGYGAVIDSAARLWQRKDPIGAFAVGPCVGTLESVLATATPASPEVGE